jgi:hypothetical protein
VLFMMLGRAVGEGCYFLYLERVEPGSIGISVPGEGGPVIDWEVKSQQLAEVSQSKSVSSMTSFHIRSRILFFPHVFSINHSSLKSGGSLLCSQEAWSGASLLKIIAFLKSSKFLQGMIKFEKSQTLRIR